MAGLNGSHKLDTSQSMKEVDMAYNVAEIGRSEEGATDTSAKGRPKNCSRHDFCHIKQHGH